MNKKIIIALFLSISIFFVFKIPIVFSATSSQKIVIFINQIRGEECCDVGSTDNLILQLNKFKNENLPANFAIRYDALKNPKYISLLRGNINKNVNDNLFEYGAFLEITPSLAKDSKVNYQGNNDNWYKAHIVYTIGYDFEDRKKIIDQYFFTFKNTFGFYPKFVTAWIIDTPSANYIKEKYDVKVVQITREQWGVDSYTLHGGYVHYPYFASNNWLFMPKQNLFDDKDKSSDDLLVLRQTGSDPLYNYGDKSSAFTTQPNDYARDGKKIEYFYQLTDRLLNQNQNEYSFLLLGLENSMEDKYQKEYLQQIDYIKSKNIKSLKTSEVYEYLKQIDQNDISFVYSNDVTNKSSFQTVFAQNQNYRARFLIKDNSLFLTDLRIFSDEFSDPYTDKKANNSGYFIAPHVFDSARFYELDKKDESLKEIIKNKLKELLLPEYKKDNKEAKVVENDTKTIIDGLQISEINNPELYFEKNKIIVKNDKKISTEIEFSFDTIKYQNQNNSKSKFVEVGIKDYSYKTEIECNKQDCVIKMPKISSQELSTLRTELYPYFFPELVERTLDINKTTVYAHNQYAIFQQNPIRVVVIPKDKNGFQIKTNQIIKIHDKNNELEYKIHEPQTNGTTFVDINSKTSGKKKITVEIGELKKEVNIYFVYNCGNKNQLLNCLKKPSNIYWYLMHKFYSKMRSI